MDTLDNTQENIVNLDIALLYAINGDIDNLSRMKENGYNFTIHCGFAACVNGDLKTLQWLLDNGCPLNYYNYIFAVVCKSPHFYIPSKSSMFSLAEKHFLVHLNKERMDECFLKDNSHILDWLLRQGVRCNVSIFLRYCLCKNNYHALRWAFKNLTIQPEDYKSSLKLAGIYARDECEEELEFYMEGISLCEEELEFYMEGISLREEQLEFHIKNTSN